MQVSALPQRYIPNHKALFFNLPDKKMVCSLTQSDQQFVIFTTKTKHDSNIIINLALYNSSIS